MNQPNILALIKDCEVEWKSLDKLAIVKTGQAISKQKISEKQGSYPVINSGKEPLGYIDEWNTENDPIGVTTRGAGVGSITWQDGKYFRGNLNYAITVRDKEKLNVRFLYYLLLQNQSKIHSLCTFSGIPALNASELKKLELPIPELKIQQKIVKILDKFTELEATLEATLEAELTLRKKQYEFYRNQLLTFDNNSDRGGITPTHSTKPCPLIGMVKWFGRVWGRLQNMSNQPSILFDQLNIAMNLKYQF